MTVSRYAQAMADALLALADDAQITAITEKPWHSATFAGLRLTMQILLEGPKSQHQAERLSIMLPDHEFSLHRHFVAEIAVRSALMEIEILLIEE
jgi:hypothetical protein